MTMLINSLKLVSYNSTGLGESRMSYIREMLDQENIDILLLQETWLLSNNVQKLGTIHPDYLYHGISGIDESELLRGRPYGGTAILWRKSIASCVKPITIPESKRVCGVSVQCSDMTLLVMSCYMPVDNYSKSHISEEFLDVCDAIECVINSHSSHSLVLGGDMNTDVSRCNAHDRYFVNLLDRNSLVDVWNLTNSHKDYTYYDHSNGARSCIDHFVVSNNLVHRVAAAGVNDNALNPSNHRDIFLTVDVNVSEIDPVQTCKPGKISWHKVHGNQFCIDAYQAEIRSKLNMFTKRDVSLCKEMTCQNPKHFQELDQWCEDLITCCLSSDHVFPQTKNCKRTKLGWNEHVRDYREECLFWSHVWKTQGKPGVGVIFDNMRESKRQYCYAVRRIKKQEKLLRLNKLTDNISADNNRDFFKEIKKLYPKTIIAPSVNSLTDPTEIAECFAQKYKTLYNNVSPEERNMQTVHSCVEKDIRQVADLSQTEVSTKTIVEAVNSLKKDKSDGDRGYNSNHLLYAGLPYFEQLAMMLSCMLVHGYQPEALLLATISSIPKDARQSLCVDTNYRGIALSSSIGKVYDKVLLIRNTEHLYSSYLQFAYKKKLSTTICTLALKEVVNYYMENQSNVYSTFIDASKAFDMVRHDCLFKLLMKRKVPAVDLRLLINLYERQKVRTTWAGQYSSAFSTTNGIRQGSIASPILFCCYIDELITKLEAHGAGCWMSRYYCGALSYADDLTLLSPSLSGLRKQIKVCEEYAKLYGMTFNPTKTICVLFSRKPQETVPISLGGHQLVWCKFAKHLGNYISSDLRDAKEVSMKRSDLIGRVNTVLGNLHGVPRESVMKVFRSKCCHYYGSQAWQLDQNCVKDFATMWNRCVRRLLCLPNRTHSIPSWCCRHMAPNDTNNQIVPL